MKPWRWNRHNETGTMTIFSFVFQRLHADSTRDFKVYAEISFEKSVWNLLRKEKMIRHDCTNHSVQCLSNKKIQKSLTRTTSSSSCSLLASLLVSLLASCQIEDQIIASKHFGVRTRCHQTVVLSKHEVCRETNGILGKTVILPYF